MFIKCNAFALSKPSKTRTTVSMTCFVWRGSRPSGRSSGWGRSHEDIPDVAPWVVPHSVGPRFPPDCILRSFLWVVLSRRFQGPRFFFCPPLWKTDWQLVTGRALVLGTHRKPCRRCPEPQRRKCGQASTRWGTRCRPIMFHWNPNKAPDSGSFPWDSPVGNWHQSRPSQQLVPPC